MRIIYRCESCESDFDTKEEGGFSHCELCAKEICKICESVSNQNRYHSYCRILVNTKEKNSEEFLKEYESRWS